MRIGEFLFVAIATVTTARASVIFDFESVTSGTATPFVHPGSITASFSSPDGPVFTVGDVSFLSSLTGQGLLDSDPSRHALDIVFSSAVTSLNFAFALASDPISEADQLTWVAYSGGIGGVIVGTGTVSGLIPLGFFYPEGLVSISGVSFDSIRLTATSTDFAVDNLSVDTSTNVPEPSQRVLFGIPAALAFCAKALVAHRRKQKSSK